MSKDEKPLPWTDEEIVRHYRTAKDKAAIIPILADLNAVSPSRIRQVLRRNGVKAEAVSREEQRERVRKPYQQKVFTLLEHDGVEYTIADIMQRIKRSQTYVTRRLEGVDTVTFDGVEYKILRYKKWGKVCGCSGKIETGTEKS